LDPALIGDEKSLENALSNTQGAAGTAASGRISAGTVSDPVMALDRELDFGGPIQVTDWVERLVANKDSGGTTAAFPPCIPISLRQWDREHFNCYCPDWSGNRIRHCVLIALLIGIGLTRKITYSVANLYRATQYINRGDFSHRIDVRSKDQLAALQVSFNSMTDNLEKADR